MFLGQTSLKMPRICVRLAQDGMGRLERGDLLTTHSWIASNGTMLCAFLASQLEAWAILHKDEATNARSAVVPR